MIRIAEIIADLPRHSLFHYISNGALTSAFFEKAEATVNDGYVYIVLTKSGSPASELIGVFTSKRYNHVSISFDPELHTMISYNGGEKVVPPGLNHERLKQLNENAAPSIIVYRLAATVQQKKTMIDTVREINGEGSAYNLLGLVFKYSHKPNIMFCSQFVYTLLIKSGTNYFEKEAAHVKPTDFVELDYYRKLEFAYEITFGETY